MPNACKMKDVRYDTSMRKSRRMKARSVRSVLIPGSSPRPGPSGRRFLEDWARGARLEDGAEEIRECAPVAIHLRRQAHDSVFVPLRGAAPARVRRRRVEP